jgi:hypothetical protein
MGAPSISARRTGHSREDIEALSLYFVYGAEGQFVHASPLTINAYCHASAGWWPGLAGEACSR